MSPEQIAVLTSVVSLVQMLSSWPVIGIIFLMVIGPWVMSIMLAWSYRKQWNETERGSKERFEKVVRMYKDNVKLVQHAQGLADDLKDVVVMNTQAMTMLKDEILHSKG